MERKEDTDFTVGQMTKTSGKLKYEFEKMGITFEEKAFYDILKDTRDKFKFEFAEERRLWYVALTRTRGSVYIIADFDKPSPFLLEIKDKGIELNHDNFKEEDKSILCPHCKSGHLVIRVNKKDGQKFLGCSNYPHCDYTINDFNVVKQNKRCPRCGDFMEFKRGKYGAYYHCHNRHCNLNINYKFGARRPGDVVENYANADKHPEFVETITYVRGRMRDWNEKELLMREGKNINGIIFNLENNYGYRERTQVSVNGSLEQYLSKLEEAGEGQMF